MIRLHIPHDARPPAIGATFGDYEVVGIEGGKAVLRQYRLSAEQKRAMHDAWMRQSRKVVS